mgnify:CR=1 FL=1
MKLRILPGRAHGTVAAPPSKSAAHRLLLAAALARGESRIHGISESEDMRATLGCLPALGATFSREGTTVTVSGGGEPPAVRRFLCGESGSTLRFCIPPALTGGESVFEGTERLFARGIGVYETAFAGKGILMEKAAKRITLRGVLPPGDYEIPGNVSSQFATGLLFALPRLAGGSTLTVRPPVESRPYIDLTTDILGRFGVTVHETAPGVFQIPGGQFYMPGEHTAEGDWSNAAPLLALTELGGNVCVTGLDGNSRQGDRVFPALAKKLRTPGAEIDVSACPDLAPVLFALAALQHGGEFTGTARLRIKESDRAGSMKEELARCGVRVEIGENRVSVSGGAHAPQTPFSAHNDHRIVMALSLLCARFGGEIEGAEALNKSYPTYAADLRRLGLEVQDEV